MCILLIVVIVVCHSSLEGGGWEAGVGWGEGTGQDRLTQESPVFPSTLPSTDIFRKETLHGSLDQVWQIHAWLRYRHPLSLYLIIRWKPLSLLTVVVNSDPSLHHVPELHQPKVTFVRKLIPCTSARASALNSLQLFLPFNLSPSSPSFLLPFLPPFFPLPFSIACTLSCCRTEVNLRAAPQYYLPYFLRWGLSLAWVLTSKLGRRAPELWSACHHTWLFTWVLGIGSGSHACMESILPSGLPHQTPAGVRRPQGKPGRQLCGFSEGVPDSGASRVQETGLTHGICLSPPLTKLVLWSQAELS